MHGESTEERSARAERPVALTTRNFSVAYADLGANDLVHVVCSHHLTGCTTRAVSAITWTEGGTSPYRAMGAEVTKIS